MTNVNQFIIKSNENLGDFNGWKILKGDFLTIDSSTKPKVGDMVLVHENVQKWNYQQEVRGVVIYAGRQKA